VILLIICVSILQILLYRILEKLKLEFLQYLILALILIAHVFFFPDFFAEKNVAGDNFVLWIIGTKIIYFFLSFGFTLGTHVIYDYIKTLKQIKKLNNLKNPSPISSKKDTL
jgi:hypothetical protein